MCMYVMDHDLSESNDLAGSLFIIPERQIQTILANVLDNRRHFASEAVSVGKQLVAHSRVCSNQPVSIRSMF